MAIALDDGVIFDVESATAEEIRDEEIYTGVRVTMKAQPGYCAPALPYRHERR